MDRSTKERLTGAIVLVAVAWLVIPVFLDGPEEDAATIQQRVELPGRDTQQTQTRTILLEPEGAQSAQGARVTDPPPATRRLPAPPAADRSPDPGAAAEPPPESPAPEPESEAKTDPEAEEPARPSRTAEAAAPASAVAPATTPDKATDVRLWAVQLGSFSNQANAEGLAADLRKQGFAAFLSRVDASGKSLHRVRVGPQASREEAEKVAARLKAAGHNGQVVSHP